MKRWGILAALLLLGGCAAQPQQASYEDAVREKLGGAYSFTAAMTYDEIEGEAMVEKLSEDSYTITMQKPDSMQGMILTLTGEDARMTYHGMEVDLTGYQLPAESVASLLRRILGGADAYTFMEQEDTVTATAGDVLFHYSILFDRATMTPQCIEIPELGFTVQITDFKVMEQL